MSGGSESQRIRSLRPAKPAVDPWCPLGLVKEEERLASGVTLEVLTVFLAGSECPFTCVFCDLWRHTLEAPTPRGAIPAQLAVALAQVRPLPDPCAVKLYNASNFFDPIAVPREDWPAIAELLAPAHRVTVECHPRLIGADCQRFAEQLSPELEVAMGLETVHPEALARLNKQMTIEDFDRATEILVDQGISVRAFVLVGAPFVPPAETLEWALQSVEHALDQGVGVVSLIPVRSGVGELERLAASGDFEPPSLGTFEAAVEGALALGRGVVLGDLWDIDGLATCTSCSASRIARLKEMNRTGAIGPPIGCDLCGGAAGA